MSALRTHRLTAQVATTLAAWAVAFAVVTTLLTLFGDQLGALPPALRALVISGTLVSLMVNLVMPAVGGAISRWAHAPKQPAGRGR